MYNLKYLQSSFSINEINILFNIKSYFSYLRELGYTRINIFYLKSIRISIRNEEWKKINSSFKAIKEIYCIFASLILIIFLMDKNKHILYVQITFYFYTEICLFYMKQYCAFYFEKTGFQVTAYVNTKPIPNSSQKIRIRHIKSEIFRFRTVRLDVTRNENSSKQTS